MSGRDPVGGVEDAKDPKKITGKNVGAYPATWERWDAAALACHKTRQDWIRDTLNEAASKVEAKIAKSAPQ